MHINRFGEYQLDLTQLPLALNDDIQVITTPAKKGKVVKMVATAAQKRDWQKPRKKKFARQMKFFWRALLHITNFGQHLRLLLAKCLSQERILAIPLAHAHRVFLATAHPLYFVPLTLLGKSLFWYLDHLRVLETVFLEHYTTLGQFSFRKSLNCWASCRAFARACSFICRLQSSLSHHLSITTVHGSLPGTPDTCSDLC